METPRDNKNLPTGRGVGHIHRFQRRILPHTHSQSVQEVHAFSSPGSILPVQSPTLWPIHSPMEFTVVAKEVKLMALEGPRVTGKSDPGPQVPPPPSKVVAGGKQCAIRSTITPSRTCSANIYRCIKRRVGCSLRRAHCKGNLVPSREQAAHKPLRAKSSVLALKEFRTLCYNKTVLIATDNTTVVAYINKDGGWSRDHCVPYCGESCPGVPDSR